VARLQRHDKEDWRAQIRRDWNRTQDQRYLDRDYGTSYSQMAQTYKAELEAMIGEKGDGIVKVCWIEYPPLWDGGVEFLVGH